MDRFSIRVHGLGEDDCSLCDDEGQCAHLSFEFWSHTESARMLIPAMPVCRPCRDQVESLVFGGGCGDFFALAIDKAIETGVEKAEKEAGRARKQAQEEIVAGVEALLAMFPIVPSQYLLTAAVQKIAGLSVSEATGVVNLAVARALAKGARPALPPANGAVPAKG